MTQEDDPHQPDARWPGWDAIDEELRLIHGDNPPHTFAAPILSVAGGPRGLDNVSAYKQTHPTAHWHYVTYGLTELYEKTSDVPEVSGHGFELTFRLACRDEDELPPPWPVDLLKRLARYVMKTGSPLARGDAIDLDAPLQPGSMSQLTGCLVVDDPAFSEVTTEHGGFFFRQLVGITKREYDAINAWNGTAFSDVMAQTNPWLVTDVARPSVLEDADTKATVLEGTERDGSSLGRVFATVCAWSQDARSGKVLIQLDALAASSLGPQLRGRLMHQRRLTVVGRGGPAHTVALVPGPDLVFTINADKSLEVTLPPAAADALSRTLRADAGRCSTPACPLLELEVVPPPAFGS